jgi:hypothetical protein
LLDIAKKRFTEDAEEDPLVHAEAYWRILNGEITDPRALVAEYGDRLKPGTIKTMVNQMISGAFSDHEGLLRGGENIKKIMKDAGVKPDSEAAFLGAYASEVEARQKEKGRYLTPFEKESIARDLAKKDIRSQEDKYLWIDGSVTQRTYQSSAMEAAGFEWDAALGKWVLRDEEGRAIKTVAPEDADSFVGTQNSGGRTPPSGASVTPTPSAAEKPAADAAKTPETSADKTPGAVGAPVALSGGVAREYNDLMYRNSGKYIKETYKSGGKKAGAGGLDCSGLVSIAIPETMRAVNKQAGSEIFDKRAINAVQGSAAEIVRKVEQAAGRPAVKNPPLSYYRPGMIVGLGPRAKERPNRRHRNIMHASMIIRDDAGQLRVYESNSYAGGVAVRPLEQVLREYRGRPIYVVDPLALASGQAGNPKKIS